MAVQFFFSKPEADERITSDNLLVNHIVCLCGILIPVSLMAPFYLAVAAVDDEKQLALLNLL